MHSTAAQTCQGQVMRPGDVCDIMATDGSGGSFDYQQVIARHQATSHAHFVEGIILILIDVVILAFLTRAAQRQPPASSAAGLGKTR